MALHKFSASKQTLSRDLNEVKLRIGGQAGTISVGQEKVPALKLKNNLYVTDQNIPKTIQKIASMDKVDVHQLKGRADLVYFIGRYRAFEGVR